MTGSSCCDIFLIDTNIASFIIKGTFPTVDQRARKVPDGHVFVSVITEAELRFGIARLPAPQLRPLIEEFLLNVDILPWDSGAAREYSGLRALLEREGRRMGSLDMMIAAHALAIGAVLVTNDSAFQRIKNLKSVDWTKT